MSDEAKVRVLLADDHTMLREGLRRSLVNLGYDVVGEAADGSQAVAMYESLEPDVVLMDVTMPVLDGIAATRRITDAHPAAKIVVLTMHADARLVADATTAGAHGYLVKDCTTDDIVAAVERARSGGKTFPEPAAPPAPDGNATSTGERPVITAREAEVLQLIADGKSTSRAAEELYVSVKTVKNHLASAYMKLDAHDRTQAVLRAARLGLITLPGEQ